MRYLICLSFLLCGCGAQPAPTNVNVPLAELAPGMLDAAKKKLPDVTFDSARKKKVKGEEVFEIRGKQPNGKIREVEFNSAGVVIEVE